MRSTFSALAALALVLGLASALSAKPTKVPCDLATLATAQLALAEACPCDTAVNHGQHVSCTARWLVQSLRDGTLPRSCRRSLRRAAVHSTCGKPNFVTCCRSGAAGTRCIIRTESLCLRLGGTVGATSSCSDACASGSPSGAFLAPTSSLF